MFFLAPFIVNALISIAISVAASLVQQMFKQDQKNPAQGVRGSIQTGGDNPLAFIMGRYGTAGQLEYAGTWGNDGDTPNAYFTKVISVSDLPVRGLAGLFVGSERVTVLPTAANPTPWFPFPPGWMDVFTAIGNPVEQYRVDGKDHLWVKFYDGTQTAADPFLMARFGSDPDRPWQSDMIARGVAYVIITALVNRELFSGLPDYLMEIDGIPLNDRRDGTAQHDNPMVAIDHLLGGLSYGGQWVYGPQSISLARRPIGTWQPQMDKCDGIVDGDKAFRFGFEVVVDQEPHVVIGEYLKACEGRIAEIGGIYKVLVGGPDAPVVSFTDEDIVITEGQTFDPFPGLEATYNGITATYPEPAEAWENKEAPPRYRSDLEVLDDNRRLPFSTTYGAVPYAVQVQRLMRAAIEETRRFRKHVHTMPPEWWEFEPLDAAGWTSERHGYANKVFLITAQDDLSNGNQIPALLEQDPADYDWSSDYVLPWDVVPLVISRPAPQEVKGFYVEPAIANDDQGRPRRPAIDCFWDVLSVTADVRAVRILLFLADALQPEWQGEAPDPIWGSARLTQAILPNTIYDVQIEYVPFSGRATMISPRLRVTTPDIRLGPLDVIYGDIDLDQLGIQIEGYFDWLGENMRELIEQAQAQAVLTGDQELANAMQFDEMRRSLSVVVGDISATFDETITTAIVPMQGQLTAIADQVTTLTTEVGNVASSVTVRGTAQTSPGGGWARWGVEVKTGTEGDWSSGAFFIDTNGTTSRAAFVVDQFVITDGTTNMQPFLFEGGVARMVAARIGTVTSGRLQSFDNKMIIDLDNKRFSIST